MYCNKCGEKLSNDAGLCKACGSSMEDPSGTELVQGEQENLDLAYAYVRKNQDYYFLKWKKENSWNWAAFFLAPFWLGYRKMYRYLFMLFGAYLVTDILLLLIYPNYPESWDYSIGTAGYAVIGIKGNDLYKQKTYQMAERIKQQGGSLKDQLYRLEKAGGTTGWGILLAFLVLIGYALLLEFMYM